MANSYTLAGTAKARGLGQVDPRLVEIIAAAAARSPYQVQIFSGKRFGSAGGSRHNTGNAIDIALIDPTTGQVIPNYKSSTGFPIYAEFARIAREEQMRIAPDLADQFRWGGGFSDKDFDLMHFDLKPGGAMAYWSWEDGGKLTPAGERAVPKFGAGWIYANGQRYRAPEGQYASLWGREPLPAPKDAQTAIAGLIAPQGGPAVPDQPTAAMGYAPTIPVDASFSPSPAMPPVQTAAAPPPPPSPPPQWASATGFPIDEALTGATAQDVLAGGPRLDPRRASPASGFVPPDMGAMVSPADVLAAGPRLDPRRAVGSAPVGPTTPAGVLETMQAPRLRPGGAPDASLVPNPPPRAQGIPNPPPRPSLSIGPGTATTGAGMGTEAFGPQIDIPPPPVYPQQRGPDMRGDLPPPAPSPYDDWTRAFDIPPPFTRMAENPLPERPNRTEYPSMVAGRPEFPGANPPVRDFGSADPSLSLPPQWSPATSFPPPPAPIGTVEAGSTGGEFFTPGGWPTPAPEPLAQRFDDAFSPGGPGQNMDLQTAFDRRNAPPAMTAQDGINSVFGAPPAQAMPPNLAIPFSEVPGFDAGRFAPAAAGTRPPLPMGAPPAAAATIASPLPPPAISRFDFDARFGGGTAVPPPVPTPGVTAGVVAGVMPQPMDIRSPAQQAGSTAGPPPLPAPPPSPRNTGPAAERERKSIAARVLGGLLGGPLGAIGGGLLGGGGGFGFGQPASFAWSGGGTAPYGNGGSTTYQKGTSNALGGSNALSWTGSKGQTVTVVENPWSPGTYFTAF
jgi:hypothetical protein